MECMFEIDGEAEPFLSELRKETVEDKTFLTIRSSGVGCGSPVLKVEVRSPLEDDLLIEERGFTFHVRRNISKYLEGAVIEVSDTFQGKKLKVNTGSACL